MSRLGEVDNTFESPESIKSDWSEHHPPVFNDEPGPSTTKETKRSHVSVEEQPSCCALCQDVLKGPVSTSCGHWFCRHCITSYWDQSASSSCPLCGKRSRTGPGLQRASVQQDVGLQDVLDEHKISLRRRYQCVTEGIDETGSGTLFNRIDTELYITEAQSEEINTQHEIWQLETASKMETLHDTPIKCQDIFKALPGQKRDIRVVLTKGLAGVGKTSKVQKFTVDWAEGLENQDVSLLILLSFRELNLINDEQYSLLTLLRVFHPTLQKVTAEKLAVCKLLFIFDGLDESKLSLDFHNDEVVSDVTQKSSVNVLLTNLIKGDLLPSALVWITSRPAAASQIPPTCVDRVTEVRGFTDAQKEEYFRRRFSDEDLSSRIISHIKNSRSLHIMCQIPVLCWITATVLDHMLTTDQRGELPKTLTDLYSRFLLVQTKRKKLKYEEGHETSPQQLMEADGEVLLKLGRLAFKHLGKGNIIFDQEDLEQCGLDVTETLVNTGVCTAIFKRERVMFQKTVYCFVHLSIQEFLAAVYMFHCYTNGNTKTLKAFLCDDDSFIVDDDDSFIVDDDDDDSFIVDDDDDDDDSNNDLYPSLDIFLSKAIDKSLHSKNGHLDLFVRFLHGLSLKSNQRHLRGLLAQTDNSPEIIKGVIKNLKKMNTYEISPDRSINIFCCLMEMNDHSVHQDIEKFLKSGNRSKMKLSDIHCSALAYVLLTSEEVLDELDLNKYKTSTRGKQRLIPAVRNCRRARLSACELTIIHCNPVALALKSNPSHLTELDLSHNYLENLGVVLLSGGLESPHCRLKVLRLCDCEITASACDSLASALKSNPSHLRELELSNNKLQDSGVTKLCDFLQNPHCRLETLRLRLCRLSLLSCASLVLALKSNPSHLRELELSKNKLYDLGVNMLCDFLESTHCRLETLRLSECRVTHQKCFSLASALKSNPSHLRALDLSRNKLKDFGVKLLCAGLQSPHCRLETLSLRRCELSEISCASLASALKSNPCHLRELDLSDNMLLDSGVEQLSDLVKSSHYRLETLRFLNAEGAPVTLTGDQKISKLEEDEGRSESPGSSYDRSNDRPPVFSNDPGPSYTMVDDKENTATPYRHEGPPSTSKTNLREESVEEEDQLYPDDPDELKRLHEFVCGAALNSNNKLSFIPERLTWSGKTSYRFRCPGPGVFQCALTELVFVMAQEAELLYKTVQWDESLLQSAGKMAAGLLFDIKCSEDAAVCQLHLPHCEIMDALLPEGLLSVVHITEDGMHLLNPLEITDTHVVVKVSHFSAVGLVKDFLKWLLCNNNNTRPVSGQVLLYLGLPNPKTQTQKLNVLLLPRNIHLDEVSAQQRHLENIQAPSKCKLIKDQSYTLHCPQASKIQPKQADFDLEFGPNYHPTFEIRLPTSKEEVTLTVEDQRQTVVWEHDVYLTDSRRETPQNNVPAEDRETEERLRSVRTEFITRVSEPDLNLLLDELLHDIISSDEMESFGTKVRTEKARGVIDTVLRKGSEASSALIAALCKVDPHLSRVLKLS